MQQEKQPWSGGGGGGGGEAERSGAAALRLLADDARWQDAGCAGWIVEFQWVESGW